MRTRRLLSGFIKTAVLSAALCAGDPSFSKADVRVDQAVRVIITLCVAGGSVTTSRATSNPSGGQFRLESDKGNFTIESQQAWGLVQGIGSALNNLNADQANRARECMRPYISQILAIIIGTPPNNVPSIVTPPQAQPSVVPPAVAPLSRNLRTEGVPIVYYLKQADGSTVTEALKRRGISFTQVAAVLPETMRTNAIFCAPGTPAAAIQELALALTDGGVPVQSIERVRRRDSRTTNALFVISRRGAELNALVSSPLSKSQIKSILACPTDRDDSIANFIRFQNPRPTENHNDHRYLDANDGDKAATLFCKQRGLSDTVGWKYEHVVGDNVVALRVTDNSTCAGSCNVFTLIECDGIRGR